MNLELTDDERRTIERRVPEILEWNRRPLRWLSRLARGRAAPGVERTEARTAEARLRLYRPTETAPRAALLFVHGGGYILGAPGMNDDRCAALARASGVLIASAYYRLAPEGRFPAAHDDVRAAWAWLRDNASALGVDEDRLGVGGESAGGGLAAGLVQRLVDEGEPVRAQLLIYPMLDERTAKRDLGRRHAVWSNRSNRVGWSLYLGPHFNGDDPPPYAVPARRAALAGLPPTWIGVGDQDLFYEEDLDYAARLEAAGVPCERLVVKNAPHGFEAVLPKLPASRAFGEAQADFLGRVLVDG